MVATDFSTDNKAFSDRAHMAARAQLYPLIFGLPEDRITFESASVGDGERANVLDGELAIDRIVSLKGYPPFLRLPIKQTVQERFRRPDKAKWQDVTFTEWNPASNTPSELYKITANIFLYGYYDAQGDRFIDAIAIDPLTTLRLMCNGKLPCNHGNNPRTLQPFACFGFVNLWKAGCVIYWQNAPKTISVPVIEQPALWPVGAR